MFNTKKTAQTDTTELQKYHTQQNYKYKNYKIIKSGNPQNYSTISNWHIHIQLPKTVILCQGGVMRSVLLVCHSVVLSVRTHERIYRCRPNMVGRGKG